MDKVRTRLAPSPTGIPHIGTIRTALYDYLLAKKHDGDFVIRIEDTDQSRYVEGSVEALYDSLEFLGLTPDEGPREGGPHAPYVQTKRLDHYQKVAQQLLKEGAAYQDEGAIRIKMPQEGETVFQDLIQGEITIPNDQVDDKVLLKSDGIPTYHLAAMVDDHLMETTHIIRGVEWISSTPVHLKIYQALGWQMPKLMHVPLLLGPDKAKLSKRHGAKSALKYRDEGYLPEAINNFLFFLGLSYQDNSAILSMEEMIDVFEIDRLQKQNAIFDIEKLNYFNGAWIRRLDNDDLAERIMDFVPDNWSKDKMKKITPLIKERLVTLKDAQDRALIFFQLPDYQVDDLLEQSEAGRKTTRQFLDKIKDRLTGLDDWQKDSIEKALREYQSQSGWAPRQAFMTTRLATTGRTATPPLFATLAVIGKSEVISRLSKALQKLS